MTRSRSCFKARPAHLQDWRADRQFRISICAMSLAQSYIAGESSPRASLVDLCHCQSRPCWGRLMSWLYLVLAIVLEVSGTTSMKLSQGFTKTLPSVVMFILYGLSLSALTLALKHIDVSVAYAVWSGLGTALIATIGVVWLREPLNAAKVISLLLIIIGVIGLHMSRGVHEH